MVAVPLTSTFSANGTYSWTAPAGVTSVTVACFGAGGGGGATSAAVGANGGGGGGGEAALEPSVAVTPGTVYTVTVGKGGPGGGGGANGTAGTDTSFAGDAITVYAHGGAPGTAGTAAAPGQGGAGGTGSSNTVAADGGAADDGTPAANGGGGGGAAGASLSAGFPGNPGSGSAGGAASGGTWPGGAGGNGNSTGGSGRPGSSPGGGAGGGYSSDGVSRAGGTGADGQVLLTWTMNDPVTLSSSTAGSVTTFQAPLGTTSVTAQAWGSGAGGWDTLRGGGSVVGATVNPSVYGLTDWLQGAKLYDSYVGRPMAVTMMKQYFQDAGPSSVPSRMTELSAAGCRFLVNYRPSQTLSTAQVTQFVASLQALQAAGIDFDVSLWAEGNTGHAFPSGAAYVNYVNYYWTTVDPVSGVAASSLGLTLVWNTLGTENAAAYYPGDSVVGAIASDYYCLYAYVNYNSTTNTYTRNAFLEDLMAFADNHLPNPIPFGLGEWGPIAVGTLPSSFFSSGTWDNYINYLLGIFGGRSAALRYGVLYYSGAHLLGQNLVTGPSDPKVAGIQKVYDTLSGAATVSGAGGGGGEFAQEAALAVTGLSSYRLVVGPGGVGRFGGASSTIAGDSVTVTAHGGSAATVQTTGGAGGTGSTNTVHHNGGAGGAGGTAGGGAGGGGSGGTSATGNTGSAPSAGAGGAGAGAVTGGGPGGAGGATAGNGSPPVTGPGGGGGGRGASALRNGAGADGQVTLSSFTIGTAFTGGLALAPLAVSGAASQAGTGGNYALAPLAVSGTANVCNIPRIQSGSAQSGTTTVTLTVTSPSAAGTLLAAVIASSGTTALTAPAGWARIATQAAGGGGGHAEAWIYNQPGDGVTGSNPGGISSAVFTGNTGDVLRGHMAEYKPPAGYYAVLDGTLGTASGGAGTTSFPVSTAGSSQAGDLGIAFFENILSAAGTNSWSTPAGWSAGPSQGGSTTADMWASYYRCGLSSGTQSVTGTAGNSTNQLGWAAILACFKINPAVTSTGSLALAPLAVTGAGNAVVPAGTVAASGGLALAPLGFQSPSRQVTFPGEQLPITVEILLNGTWTDISNYVYTRDGITITGRGRPDEASTAQPAQCTLTLNAADGSFSPQNTSGQFYPFLARNTQIRIGVNNAVTVQGAWYSGYRFWGEVPAWPPLWNLAQTDVYVPVTAVGVLQRMRQSKYSASPLARYYTNIINAASANPGASTALVPAGYWPCEDGNTAGSFFSGLPGGSPMTWTGTPGLAADTSIAGSAAFAQLDGSVWTGTPGAFTSGGITFAVPGTYQWTCPGGVTTVQAECWGGGAGGNNGIHPAGGGGGEYAAETALAVTPGKTYTLTVGIGGAGGAGNYTPGQGAGGGRSTFSGDAVTVTAHGGRSPSPDGTGGAASTGSTNTVHHNGGAGADTRTAGYGGSGGGSSGGTSSAGHAGTQATSDAGAAGGTAVTGGGPGGAGGHGGQVFTAGVTPFPGPGGGGGGGGMNAATRFGYRGGAGAAGQVRLTYGTSTVPPANIVRAVIDVPSSGGTDSANLLQFTTSGTVANVSLAYHTGGNLQLVGKSAGGATLFDSGSHSFGLNGQPVLVSAEMTQVDFTGPNPSPPLINWKLTAIKPGGTAVVATYKGSVSGNLGSVTQVNVNNAAGHTDTTATGVGHVAVQYAVDPILNLSRALAAYAGELAGTRFLRLCAEQNVPAALTGDVTDTPAMGPQPAGLLVDLLQDCENTDLGQMFERRDAFGLGYITRVALQNQAPAVTLDYAAGQLSAPLAPTNDEQLIRNDIVATRTGGGTSYEAIQTTGSLSVQDPPGGVGLYSYQVTVNVNTDSQLAGFAAWLLALGTLDEFRYPVITVDLRRPALADGTFSAMASLDIGDFLQIINPPSWLPPGPVNQLAFGFTETLNVFEWTIAVSAVPEDPYSSSNAPLPTW